MLFLKHFYIHQRPFMNTTTLKIVQAYLHNSTQAPDNHHIIIRHRL